MVKRKISATMVSQHPDHASVPYWHTKAFISTQYEAEECFLSFSELGSGEYKWDWEGKLVDESVMERLLAHNFEYFKKNPLGKEAFLTFRLPNPTSETEFRLGRAFMGILSATAMAEKVGLHSPSLFEVILPMTETAEEMIDIQEAFAEMAQLKHKLYRMENGPLKHIEVIPLFEQVETIMNSHTIIEKYLQIHKEKFGFTPGYMRPYMARSDPALNSGLVPTVLAIKVALSHYQEFEKEKGIELFPILGTAALPFRGGLTPLNIKKFAKEYSGVRTVLLQSAFRYDYEKKDVIKAVKDLERVLPQNKPSHVMASDEKKIREVVKIFEQHYQGAVEGIADVVNAVAAQLPRRRERVQHIGLFGYSRGVGKVKLPRAIGFTGALYSLGVPPEMIGTGRGLHAAEEAGYLSVVEKYYLYLREDLLQAGRFVNKDVIKKLSKRSPAFEGILQDIEYIEKYLGKKLKPESVEEKAHHELVAQIYEKFEKKQSLTDLITESAILRKSIG
jgi:phosphoenolpyruvate carboxylase